MQAYPASGYGASTTTQAAPATGYGQAQTGYGSQAASGYSQPATQSYPTSYAAAPQASLHTNSLKLETGPCSAWWDGS